MSTEPKSKFTAFLNPKANADNRLPNMTGEFAIADGPMFRFSAWAAESTKGVLYMKGSHTPLNLTTALKAQIGKGVGAAVGPKDIELKPGELILFANQKKEDAPRYEGAVLTKKRGKRPDWFGYAHISGGWYQLAGWVQDGQGRPGFIAGTTVRFDSEKLEAERQSSPAPSKSPRKPSMKLVPGN